tara:strand:+ start:57 stop:332 length:276 start_codon:yes stop_codon:yes gene_type:complete
MTTKSEEEEGVLTYAVWIESELNDVEHDIEHERTFDNKEEAMEYYQSMKLRTEPDRDWRHVMFMYSNEVNGELREREILSYQGRNRSTESE